LNLSRALGDLEYKKRTDLGPEAQIISGTPDIIEQTITPEDEFIVCACDGVWDVMTNQEVVDFVRSRLTTRRGQISDIVEELLDKCMSPDPKETQGLGCDNMTCVVVELKKK
jgi:serine/threonine protein phosphatase PrpC